MNTKKYNSKMCNTCLKLCNINALENHLMSDLQLKSTKIYVQNTHLSKKMKLQPLLQSTCTFTTKDITSNESNAENAKIHIKQYLNESHIAL